MSLGLIDIGDLTETVPVAGRDIAVTGIPIDGIIALFVRFPALREIFERRGASPAELMGAAPEIVAAIIAMGTRPAGAGTAGDAAAEAVAVRLPAGTQLHLLEAIWRLTFPKGLGAAVERLGRLAAEAGDGRSASAPSTTSPKRPRR